MCSLCCTWLSLLDVPPVRGEEFPRHRLRAPFPSLAHPGVLFPAAAAGSRGQGRVPVLNRPVPNELCRQLHRGRALFSLRALSRAGAQEPFSCPFSADLLITTTPPPPPQSILAKFRFLSSQLSAHSEKEIQKGRRKVGVGRLKGVYFSLP